MKRILFNKSEFVQIKDITNDSIVGIQYNMFRALVIKVDGGFILMDTATNDLTFPTEKFASVKNLVNKCRNSEYFRDALVFEDFAQALKWLSDLE